VAAFALLGLLQGISLGMQSAISALRPDRLYTRNRINITSPLPLAYLNAIRKIPGVVKVAHWTYFVGYYQEPKQGLAIFATSPLEMFDVFSELGISRDLVTQMANTRTGAIIGRATADRFGWKIGDHIPLTTAIWTDKAGSNVWYFDVVGIFKPSAGTPIPADSVFINFDYFDEGRAFGNGYVHLYIESINNPTMSRSISKEIDRRFVNSDAETQTQDERAYGRTQLKRIDDTFIIANAVGAAVLFALLFLTSNAIMQSVKDRTPEFALLKALGFAPRVVLFLVFFEAVSICLVSAVLGIVMARVLYPIVSADFGNLGMPWTTFALCVVLSLAIALASAAIPAFKMARLPVAQTLFRRA
jgi:putative ABC transport system permease protein